MKKTISILTALSLGFATYATPIVLAEPTFQPHGWNVDRRDNQDGSVTDEFTQEYSNYYDNGWKNNDLTLVDQVNKFTVTAAPYSLEVPVRANGTFKFTDKHKGRNLEITEDPISKSRVFTDANNTLGVTTATGIQYPNSVPNVDSLVIELDNEEVRYLLRWDARPSICDSQPTFNVNFRQTPDSGLVARKFNNELVSSTDESLNGFYFSSGQRSITTPQARIWDKDRSVDIDIKGRWNPAIFTGYKVIPCDFFDNATFPVWSDDVDTFNPATGDAEASDGYHRNTAVPETWANIRNAGSAVAVYPLAVEMGIQSQSAASNDFQIQRAFLQFATGSIPDTNTISSATIKLTSTSTYANGDNDGDDYFAVVDFNPASSSSSNVDDYDQYGTTEFSDQIDLSSISTETQYTWNLNAAGIANINKTGTSSFGVREGHDILNNQIATGTNNYVGWDTSDQTSGDPVLTVTHVAGAAGSSTPPNSIFFM